MKSTGLTLGMFLLLLTGSLTLKSIAPSAFPVYYFYIFLGIVSFFFFSHIDFEILKAFYIPFYIFSILFLLVPLIIGEVTRGAVRWIPLGPLTIQPAEIVKPFLILFLATYLARSRLDLRKFLKSLLLLLVPLFLIFIQPSLGVAILLLVGFSGVFLAIGMDKKIIFMSFVMAMLFLPLSWLLLAPYQKMRVKALINPNEDPSGTGYNSIQSMISVGSGKISGRGLGEGVQTQLSFLPERHTDFIFASISEELGFVGAIFLLLVIFFCLYRIIKIIESSKDLESRAFASGAFLTLFVQTFVHIGMNMGLLPITGIPLPLISAGGSSLLSTMITFGILTSLTRR
jgi:rod shape determining protein RodA